MRNIYPYLFFYFKGIAMGAADVIPGVSGGTIAFITGIYERWVNALARLDIHAVRILCRQGVRAAWQYTDAGFLLTLAAGIATAVFSLAKLLRCLLDQYPVPVWAFFFGLILGAVFSLSRHLPHRSPRLVLMMVTGAAAAVILSLLPGTNNPTPGLLCLFFSGMLAICAMILPGISGAFILVLLGVYPAVLDALRHLQWLRLGVFALGALTGLLLFSRLLRYLLTRHHALSIALLTGFIAGSLVKIWPWKDGSFPVSPTAFAGDAQIGTALLLMLAGLGTVLFLESRTLPNSAD